MEAFCNSGCINKVPRTNFTNDMTIQRSHFDSPLHYNKILGTGSQKLYQGVYKLNSFTNRELGHPTINEKSTAFSDGNARAALQKVQQYDIEKKCGFLIQMKTSFWLQNLVKLSEADPEPL